MDIAKLGVGIDPAKAVDGTKRVKQALKEVGESARKELKKVDDASDKAGKSTKKLATDARRGFGDMSRGITDLMDGVGLMDNGFGRLIRRGMAMVNSFGSMRRGMQAVGAQATATGAQTTAAANAGAAANARLAASTTAAGSAASGAAGAFRIFGLGAGALIGILAGVLAAVVGLIAGFMALAKGISLVRQGMELAGPVQQSILSFKTMTGSLKEANRVMKELREQSKLTGAALEGSSSTAKRFMALGFSPDDALKLNRSILDVAGSIGMSNDEAKLLGAALAQVQAKGVVSMEELRQQIAEKGVPVFQELAAKIGVTTGALIDMVSKNEVPAKALIDIFLNLEGGFAKFAGGAEKMTATLPGAIGRLKANWEDLLITIGQPVNEALAPMLNQLSDFLATLQPMAKAFGDQLGMGLRALMSAIQSGEIGTVFGLALNAGLELAASLMVTAFQAAIAGLVSFALSIISNMITFIVRFFGGLITGIINTAAKVMQGDFQGALGVVGDFFNNLFTGGGGIIANIAKAIYNALGKALIDVVNEFMLAFWKGWKAITNAIDAGKAKLGMAPDELGGKLDSGPKQFTFTPLETNFKGAADDLVGTGARDRLADFIKNRGQAPGDPPDSPLPPASPELTDGPGKDKKGKAAKIPKAKEIQEIDTQVQRLIKDWMDLELQQDAVMASLAQGITQSVGGGLMDLIKGTQDLKGAFTDMATSILDNIARMVIQMYLQLAVAKSLAAMGYGGSGGAGMAIAGKMIAHTGGVAGGPMTTSGGIPSFHKGGASTAESMVKVERGETILTKRRASELEDSLARRQSGGKAQAGKGTTIVNVTDQRQILDVIASNPDAIVNAISRRQPAVRNIVGRKERQ